MENKLFYKKHLFLHAEAVILPLSWRFSEILQYSSSAVCLYKWFESALKYESSHHPPPKPGWSEADLAFFMRTVRGRRVSGSQ
jgi:hypothetical protein